MSESNGAETGRLDANGALALLREGNGRFVRGAMQHPHASVERRRTLLSGQQPCAAVVSCSDSRVAPEILFDRGLGDLFVVRTAGHVLGEAGLASLEYAVLHLHVPLILVLGHSECGAVHAALMSSESLPGHLRGLARAILPAIAWTLEEAKRTGLKRSQGEPVEEEPGKAAPAHNRVAQLHARMTAEGMTAASAVIGEHVKNGSLRIQAAFYDLASGTVELID